MRRKIASGTFGGKASIWGELPPLSQCSYVPGFGGAVYVLQSKCKLRGTKDFPLKFGWGNVKRQNKMTSAPALEVFQYE